MKREFQFVSAGSSKFWTIELKKNSFEVVYGKIGATGTKQVKTFSDATRMKKAADKLVAAKTSKGYVEVGPGRKTTTIKKSNAKASLPPTTELIGELFFGTTKDTRDLRNIRSFIGKPVIHFKSSKSVKTGGNVYALRQSIAEFEDGSDERDFCDLLNEFLNSDAAPDAIGLIIGNWSSDGTESNARAIKVLSKQAHRLPNLRAIFHGDISPDESEISWIIQSDVSALVNSFPKLQLLRVRGGNNLQIKTVRSRSLRALAIETGGLDRKVVGQVFKAELPNLEYLELWLGATAYGGNCRCSDFQPIFSGKVFPKLKYLGLRNSEIADELAAALATSPIARRLETIDLSLGTMTDVGGRELLKLPTTGKLKRLDLHHNYLTKTAIKDLKSLPISLNSLDQQTPEDWGDGELRFVATNE